MVVPLGLNLSRGYDIFPLGNVTSYFRFAYVTYMAKTLMDANGGKVDVNFVYDANCRYKVHMKVQQVHFKLANYRILTKIDVLLLIISNV